MRESRVVLVNAEKFIAVLRDEIELSTGCTDPGSVCLAVSRATRELGQVPQKIRVIVSPNIYKNGISVGIPGTDRQGLCLAAALGAIIDASEEGLGILNHVTPEIIKAADNLLEKDAVRVTCADGPDPLYVSATVSRDSNWASAIIQGDYSRIIQVSTNNQVVFSLQEGSPDREEDLLNAYSVEELYHFIEQMDSKDLSFLVDYAYTNYSAVRQDLDNPTLPLGSLIAKGGTDLRGPQRAANLAQVYTAAAGEARMRGVNVPIVAVSGSGNHGITNFLGILAVADALDVSKGDLARALGISTMITIYIKGYIKRMTAFCGCAVAAATGVAAGTVYLLGGVYQQAVNAMQSVIGTLGGMFCDGAKESCAYKLSTAAYMAVQFAYLALENCHIPPSVGVVGPTIEKTFANLGKLNNPGMAETDRVIIAIIKENRADQKKLGGRAEC
jgi:L-cysteine desulfidase